MLGNIFFSIWVFFHDHSGITELQGKGEGNFLSPHHHLHPLHTHLDITRAITAESLPLHIGSSQTQTMLRGVNGLINLLTPGVYKNIISTQTILQLKTAGLFRYVLPFSRHQALKV